MGVFHTPILDLFFLKSWKYHVLGRMQYAPTHLVRATYFFEDVEENIKKQKPQSLSQLGLF